jgi:putative acetyltransferase
MAVVVRPMLADEARAFLDIHARSVRGLAASHYPPAVIDAWVVPATDESVRRFLENPDGELRLLAELDGTLVGLGCLVVQKAELRACYVAPGA